MKIAACLIVKDDGELPKLKQSVASFKDYVDYVCITANGKDVSGIEKYCKENNFIYSYRKWTDDFADQRNFAFLQAPEDTTWYYWQDADDVLVGGENLPWIAQLADTRGKDVVFIDYWYGCTFTPEGAVDKVDIFQRRERLIRKNTHRWVGRLHETPIKLQNKKDNYTTFSSGTEGKEIHVIHTKQMDEAVETMERNKRILELQLEDERKKGKADPRTLLYLMKIYAELSDPVLHDKCIEMGKEYMASSGWDEERAVASSLVGTCYLHKMNITEALEWFHKAVQESPLDPVHYLKLALTYFNLDKVREAEHWLKVGTTMEMRSDSSAPTNIQEMKVLSSDLMAKIAYKKKETAKAFEASKMLFDVSPTEGNYNQMVFLESANALNEGCKAVHTVFKYLEDIGSESAIPKLLDDLPQAITTQPFAIEYRRKYMKAKVWAKNEICYFANFGGKHFEEWSDKSLIKGIGGSETAVIELAREWTKKGYKVTVYGDPGADAGVHEGVTYLPWYFFNINDTFNIFIQWRSAALAGKLKCNKFYVDLHDLYYYGDLEPSDAVDAYMVKSEYHKSLCGDINPNKFVIIGNGVTIPSKEGNV